MSVFIQNLSRSSRSKRTCLMSNGLSRARRTCLILCLTLLCSVLFIPRASATITGDGSADHPYTINNEDDLNTFQSYVWNSTNNTTNTTYISADKHWLLTTNITWRNPLPNALNHRIGHNYGSDLHPFTGYFDGGGYTIDFGFIENSESSSVGFFGGATSATIKNLTITGDRVSANNDVGGLIGVAIGQIDIENVHVILTGTSNFSGTHWGGLIGKLALDLNNTCTITSCSVIVNSVQEYTASTPYYAGGLIGMISSNNNSIAKVNITDCMADVNFFNNNNTSNINTIGGFVGLEDKNITLNMMRCYTTAKIPPGSTTNARGFAIGSPQSPCLASGYVYYGDNKPAGLPMIGEANAGSMGLYGSSFLDAYGVFQYSNVFNLLERGNNSGGTYATDTRGNESWGYDIALRPQVSKTGYAVKVMQGAYVKNISGQRYQSGYYYYANADDTLTVHPSITLTSHQRMNYTFTTDGYDCSTVATTGNYTATMDSNNWKLTARVNGTVDGALVTVPYPRSGISLSVFTSEVFMNLVYDNPDGLTGKFYVYRRQLSDPSGDWTLREPTTDTSVETGSNRTMYITDAISTADFSKQFQYCITFVEGNDSPLSPSDYGFNINNSDTTLNVDTTPLLNWWTVTATGDTTSITVTFNTDNRFTNSTSYSYAIQRSINGGAFEDWLTGQTFSGATEYSRTDNTPTSSCDSYKYQVVISAFNTTFSQQSGEAHITGNTKFAATAPFKSSKGEYPNYVRLQWNVNKAAGGGDETYRVFRRVANTNDAFVEMQTVTSNAATVYWNDDNALTGVYYEYQVTLYQECTGVEKTLDTKSDIGFTQSFGTVLGRVTYGTGSAVQGVNMIMRRNDLGDGESQYYSLKSSGGGSFVDLSAPNIQNIEATNQWSLQFWILPDGRTNNGTNIQIGTLGNYSLQMDAVSDGFKIHTDGGGASSAIIPANRYSHITITRSGNNWNIYTVVDQNPDSIYIVNTPYTSSQATSTGFDFGRSLSGNIDDVRFWNRALTSTEIMGTYSRRLVGNEAGLVGYWTFDENLNGYAFDMSRAGTVYNGNHAILNTLTFDNTVPDDTYQLGLKGITDSNGNYQIGGIPFQGEGTSYSIVPSMGVHVFNPTQQFRYISPSSMVQNGTDFTDISAFNVTGTVVYDGGNYPVQGCSFEIDDQTVTNPNGSVVTTDYNGNFTISVPIGIHKVRIVKQGHNFANGGLLLNAGQNLNYNAPVNNVMFYDQTKVKLIGRVVGGSIEDSKPLGFGESVNNIGVNAVTLNSTRTQYNFVDVSKDTVITHNQGQWKKPGSLNNDTTKMTYNSKDITIHVSPLTGEFVAMVYPEPYNLSSITVPSEGGPNLTVYSNNEMIDLTSTVVPDASYLQTSVRSWLDSTFVANVPGTVDHWNYFTSSDTVRYNSKWTYYYQATPTFSVKQLVDSVPVNYFGDTTYIVTDNLTNTNDTLSLYNKTDGTYLFGQPLFRQGTIYDFLFSAYEKYTNYVSNPAVTIQYPVISGSVNMSNNIDLNQNLSPIQMDSTGRAIYEFTAGPPNLTTGTNNFVATLNLGAISYYWDMGTTPITAWHLGDRTTGTNFMTAGPDQITTILRDPPGNTSNAFIEQGTTITTTTGLSISAGVNTETGLTASLGPKLTTFVGLGAGVITEEETKIDISANLNTEYKYTSATENTETTTFTERFETSADPSSVGAGGDVFIGNSTNILYGLTNGISIQKNYVNEFTDPSSGQAFATTQDNVYSIAPSVSLAYGQTFDTRFAFTQSDIEQSMIPKWRTALATLLKPVGTALPVTTVITDPVYVSKLPQSDANFGKLNTDPVFGGSASAPEHFDDGPSYKIYFPDGYDMTKFTVDSVMYFNNQIKGWINVLAQNEKEKIEMTKKGNYSFGGGASIQYSNNTTAQRTATSTYNWVINPAIGLVTGGDVMGIGLELSLKVTDVNERQSSSSAQVQNSVTTGFTLNGSNDQITVDYGTTPSGTYAFKTRGGSTACPYEGGTVTKYYQPGTVLDEATMQVEVPKISVASSPQVINVPSNRAATYTLSLQNESQTGDNIWYQLAVDQSTNPNGAIIKIDGGVIGDGRLFLVNAGSTLQKTLTIEKGTADTYDNIGIILRSQCQSDIADTAYISAQFIPACSDVAITSPTNNWILNADSQTGDTLNITIANYDVNFPNFGYIKLEFRPVGSPDWNTIMTFYPSALYPNVQGDASVKADIGMSAEINYAWKMPSADGAYELRATTASVNIVDNAIVGDPLSTYTTDAITGYKDMQRPVSLGAPSPASGILGTGDELSITFNEDIQTGMLTQNNFSITGVLNAQPLAEPNVGLAFAGAQAAKTELPIFTNGSFSIETWFNRNKNSAGTLFAYGSNNNPVSLGFDATGRVVVTIGSESYTSLTAVANDSTWKYIALTYDRTGNTFSVYEFEGATSKILFGDEQLTASPETQGLLVVGNNMAENDGFSGDVAQLSFYGVNRTQADVSAGKSVSKTGNEYGLIGYWALDEGTGTFAKDKARSRNLLLNNSDWYIYPSGYAKQTNNNYFSIPVSTYPLDIFSDLTLEFWFRSAGNSQPNQTIFSADNGSVAVNANGGLTLYKADGTENQVLTNTNLIDTKWHHIAMSVRRNGSVNVYIDGVTTATFVESMLGTMGSGYYYFGAKHTLPNTFNQYFAGYFDEIRLWNSALTSDGILLNQNSKLNGNEAGLKAYYPFETYTKQSNGLITVTSTNANAVTGDSNMAEGTATDFSTTSMSVKDVRPIENVPFTYVSSNNKIVFTLDPTYFARVEGTTLTLNVSDVYDMHNNKSNTESWTAYVNRNALRWDTDPVNITMQAGDFVTFTARITNTGGTTLSYSIDNLPMWLNVSSSAGNLQPLTNKDLTFTVNQGINIGNYETAVGLSSGNGVSEILPVQVKVTGQLPNWSVDPNAFESSMNITGQIQIAGVFQEDTYDRLGAFIGDMCVGITSPIYVDAYNAYFTFADVYGNAQNNNQSLTFKLWDASTGRVYPQLETSIGEIRFAPSTILGSPANPVIFNALNLVGQDIPLKNGWNWISADVLNDNPSILNQMELSLSNTGELIKGYAAYVQQPNWLGTLGSISEKSMYSVKVNNDCTLSLLGQYADPATTSIPIVQGWNWIGYIPSFSLPVQSALAGMNAQTGDIIKGQSSYATYMGTSGWIGSLTYMQQGKGYMYYSNNATAQSLIYPSTNLMQSVMGLYAVANEPADMKWTVNPNNFSNNMTMTAIVVKDNQEIRSDMIEIAAFSGDDCRGSVMLQYEASLDKYIGYLVIFGNGNESITLKVYDHTTETEYNTNNAVVQFAADAVYGSPSNPYIIGTGTTGIDNITASQVSVFPNPVHNDLYINYSWGSIDVVEIIDMTGHIVYRQDKFEAKSIKVSNLTPGIYTLKVTNNGNSFVNKFIKE